jgi:hypothetical protein
MPKLPAKCGYFEIIVTDTGSIEWVDILKNTMEILQFELIG